MTVMAINLFDRLRNHIFVILFSFLSTSVFAQGYINYQAFIYEKIIINQPGRDLLQTVPFANRNVHLFVEMRESDSLIFSETHMNVLTDEQGMIIIKIGSIDSVTFLSMPWSRLEYGKVNLKIF